MKANKLKRSAHEISSNLTNFKQNFHSIIAYSVFRNKLCDVLDKDVVVMVLGISARA